MSTALYARSSNAQDAEAPAARGEATWLSIAGVGHRFGDRVALDGVSLEIHQGEIYGLLGPNGSGKSTLLSVLAGVRALQEGEIRVGGRPFRRFDRAYRSRLGVVFQNPSLDPKLAVRENLILAARLYGFGSGEARQRADQQLSRTGLEERADSLVSELSGGLARRVDLARSLVHDPALLLMDEPTSGLDEASFRETWAIIERARRAGDLSVVVATHRPEEAARCDRLAVLNRGRLVTVDTPDGLQRRLARDVVVVRGTAPEEVAEVVEARLGLACLLEGRDVLIEADAGHSLIPRLVESFEPGSISSVSLRRPSLADAFLKVTGEALGVDQVAQTERAVIDAEVPS